jgi:hypothetical protein
MEETNDPIEWNLQALRRIVLNLSGMAEMAEPLAFPSTGEDSQAVQNGVTTNALTASLRSAPLPLDGGEERDATRQPRTPLPRRPGEPAKRVGEGVDPKRDGARRSPTAHSRLPTVPTIPRILWRAIVKVLRPAESAARRLIIASSRHVIVPFVRLRKPRPKPLTIEPILRRYGIAVTGPRAGRILPRRAGEGDHAKRGGGGDTAAIPRAPAFPLFDPPRRLNLYGRRRPTVPPHAAPRIMVPGITKPHRLPKPPSDSDPVSANSLIRRIAALSAALDDLPGQATRFARWKARRDAREKREKELAEAAANGDPDAIRAQNANPRRLRRHFPLRAGRPYGGRLLRYEPNARYSPKIREIDEILVRAHSMALYALDCPDTS